MESLLTASPEPRRTVSCRHPRTTRGLVFWAAILSLLVPVAWGESDGRTEIRERARQALAAVGVAPLSYQWYIKGTIPVNPSFGGTSPNLGPGTASLAYDGFSLSCRVTNGFGSATSPSAGLTVTP